MKFNQYINQYRFFLDFFKINAIIFIDKERKYSIDMDTDSIFEHYSKILDNLLDNNNWFKTYFQFPCSVENLDVNEDLHFRFGVSRGCVIDDNYDWCVKFNLLDLDTWYSYFHYCEKEEKVYLRAKDEHLSKYFAEARYIGTYHRYISFYHYNEIVDYFDFDEYEEDVKNLNKVLEDDLRDAWTDDIEISIPLFAYPCGQPYDYPFYNEAERVAAKRITSPLNDKNIAVAITFIHEYGFNEYKRISKFLSEQHLNDFHCQNAMIINGKYIFTDYSGFQSEGSSDDDVLFS